jgi:hypothetical protein
MKTSVLMPTLGKARVKPTFKNLQTMTEVPREHWTYGQRRWHLEDVNLTTILAYSLLWIFGTGLNGFITDGVFPFDDLIHDS